MGMVQRWALRACKEFARKYASLRAEIAPRLAHPYALLTFAVLCWAANIALGRAVIGTIPPITLNTLRWAIALAVIAPFGWLQLRGQWSIVRARFPQLVALAVPSVAIYNPCIYIGTHTTTAASAGLIVGTMPIAILFLASLIGEERLGWKRASGVFVSFGGIAWIITRGDPSVLVLRTFSHGDLLIVCAVVSWALYSVLLRRFRVPLRAFALLGLLAAIGLCITLPFSIWELHSGAHLVWSTGTLAALLFVGIFPSVVATIFWNTGVGQIGAGNAGLVWNLIPVFVALMGMMLLSEPVERFQLVGMAIVFAGMALATTNGGRWQAILSRSFCDFRSGLAQALTVATRNSRSNR